MLEFLENLRLLSNHPFILLLIGLTARYLIGRRRFYRRGVGGLQHFSSFWLAVITTFTEWVLALSANIVILYSLLLILLKNK